jgi:hypothetical protein
MGQLLLEAIPKMRRVEYAQSILKNVLNVSMIQMVPVYPGMYSFCWTVG